MHEHTWGDPTYAWAEDFSSCTATRVCLDNAEHKESETKQSVYTVLVEPGCESEGSAKYTVTFENSAFVTQTHEVTLDQKAIHGKHQHMSGIRIIVNVLRQECALTITLIPIQKSLFQYTK